LLAVASLSNRPDMRFRSSGVITEGSRFRTLLQVPNCKGDFHHRDAESSGAFDRDTPKSATKSSSVGLDSFPSTSTTPPSLRFGAPWRGVGRDAGLAKSGRARARLIREAKLFSEKSSQENKIFIDCSAESTKGRGGRDFDRRQVMVSAPNSRLRETANGERRTANEDEDDRVPNPKLSLAIPGRC